MEIVLDMATLAQIFAILPDRIVAWLIEKGVETQLDFAFFFASEQELHSKVACFELGVGELHQVTAVWKLAGNIHEDRTLAISLAKLEMESDAMRRDARMKALLHPVRKKGQRKAFLLVAGGRAATSLVQGLRRRLNPGLEEVSEIVLDIYNFSAAFGKMWADGATDDEKRKLVWKLLGSADAASIRTKLRTYQMEAGGAGGPDGKGGRWC